MKSIGEEPVICLSCKWTGIVDECYSDCDGEGSLGCLMCNKPVEQISNIVDELLTLREQDYEEVENEADMMTIYEGDVYITHNYYSIDPEQYMRYKEQLRKKWEEEVRNMWAKYTNE